MTLLSNLIPAVSSIFPANTADTLNMLLLAADNQIIKALTLHGYILPGLKPSQSLASFLKDTKRFQEAAAYFRKAESDQQALNLVDGILAIFGINPQEVRTSKKYKFLKDTITYLKPLVARYLGDSVYDQLYGYEGSKAILGKTLINLFYPYGISPTQLENFINALHVSFSLSPQLRQGYDNAKIAQIIQEFVKRGYMPITSSLSKFVENAVAAIKLYRFVSDELSQKAPGRVDDETIFQAIGGILAKYPGRDLNQAAFLAKAEIGLAKKYPYGEFQAAIQQFGLPIPARAIDEEGRETGYAILDEKLKQRAINSPLGMLVGATIRAVERMGAAGPLREFYDSLLSGKIPYVTPQRWITLAVQSGLTPQQASTLLSQTAANKAVLAKSPIWARVLRLAQYEYDIAPKIQAIVRRGEDPEIIRGRIAELAEQLGYRSIGPLDAGEVMLLMHSPFANEKALKALQSAYKEVLWEESIKDVTRIEPLRRLSEYVIGKAKGVSSMTLTDILNIIPPKTYKEQIKGYEEALKEFSPLPEPPEVKNEQQKSQTIPRFGILG